MFALCDSQCKGSLPVPEGIGEPGGFWQQPGEKQVVHRPLSGPHPTQSILPNHIRPHSRQFSRQRPQRHWCALLSLLHCKPRIPLRRPLQRRTAASGCKMKRIGQPCVRQCKTSAAASCPLSRALCLICSQVVGTFVKLQHLDLGFSQVIIFSFYHYL